MKSIDKKLFRYVSNVANIYFPQAILIGVITLSNSNYVHRKMLSKILNLSAYSEFYNLAI